MVSKKYAYFIACELGMDKDWLGQNVGECHQRINEAGEPGGFGGGAGTSGGKPAKKIMAMHFDQMILLF
jgi:hypothetical protein